MIEELEIKAWAGAQFDDDPGGADDHAWLAAAMPFWARAWHLARMETDRVLRRLLGASNDKGDGKR